MNPAILRRRRGGSNPFNLYANTGSRARTVADYSRGVYGKPNGDNATPTTYTDLHVDGGEMSGLITAHDADGVLKHNAHNLLTYSEDLSRAEWGYFSAASIATANYAEAPDGSTSATRLVWDNVGNDYRYQYVGTSHLDVDLTFGFWYKSTGGTDYTFAVRSGGADGLATQNLTSSSTWQYAAYNFSDSNTSVDIGFDFRTTYGSDGSGDILVWGAHLYRSDLPMQAVPTEFITDNLTTYVPTTSTARYLPFLRPYTYSGSEWVKRGIAVAPAATQLLHETDALTTQTEVVTAQPYTLHFTGTGTVTLSGASTAGPLVGTGTGEENRVSLTFTPSASTLTLTVSGTVTNAQLEAGSVRTPYISNPASSGSVSRAAFNPEIKAAYNGYDADGMSLAMDGVMTYADMDLTQTVMLTRIQTDSGNRIFATINTSSTLNRMDFAQVAGGVYDYALSDSNAFATGTNVPFSIASRHTDSDINGAVDGTALTVNSTVTALTDLSAVDIELGPTFNGYIDRFLVYPPLSDDNLETASEAS